MSFTQEFRASIICKCIAPWIGPGTFVLDVGCGNGVVSSYIKNSLGADLWGTDILAYCKTDIQFKKMENGSVLPFENDSFDAVLLNDVLHHCVDCEEIIRESLRLADQVFVFEDVESRLLKLVDIFLNRWYSPEMPCPLAFKSQKEWIELFRHLNLQWQILPVYYPVFYPFKHMAFRLTKKN